VDKKNAVVELHEAIQRAAASRGRGWKAKPHRPPVTRQNMEFLPDTSWIPWLAKAKTPRK
jgi:hypothetical protein